MPTTQEAPVYNKNNPYQAKITEKRLLNKEGSAKETLHFVVNIEGSGLTYEPGASLAVITTNSPGLVAEVLDITGFDPKHPIAQRDGTTLPLYDVLLSHLTLNRTTARFVKAVHEKLPEGDAKSRLGEIVDDKDQLTAYIFTRDYVDVMQEYPEAKFTAEEFTAIPGKIAPRLYSIASSIQKHPNEVHLTVAIVRYHTHGRDKTGIATGYLADHTELDINTLPVFFAPSKHFKLPDDQNTPIIMVGPGTGVAPFRAFLEEREVTESSGKNWMFFGDQHQATDFLYGEEFEAWQASGLLTKLDLAFSRDQDEKIYVQDRMRENGAELWQWIREGAYFYVCGDAKRMAKDVHQALIDIAIEHGNLSPEDADVFVNKTLMKEERRYLRDVY
ncbi:MAG: sulfite reductase subunit alpha [Verrucomicrobiota bacterium]